MLAERLQAFPLDEVIAERCRRSYAYFVQRCWPHVPRLAGTELRWNWHHGAVCDHAQAIAKGDLRDLLVNMPPGTMKTELLGVFFLPWVWTWDPTYKVISASVIQKLASEASGFCRQVVECEWYQRTFARGWQLRDDKNALNHFANDPGGSRFATSIGGTVIGMRAHCLVGDDLQRASDSQSEWDKAWNFWTTDMSSRSIDPATVSKMIVQQRIGKGDISSKILEHGGVTHLFIDMEYDPKRSCVTFRDDGRELFRDPRTADGELLNPRRDTLEVAREVVERAKSYAKGVGPVDYQAQYRQNPADDAGGELKPTGWRFYRHPDFPGTHRPPGCLTAAESPAVNLPRADLQMTQSADTAIKTKETSDWSVIGTLAHRRAEVFVYDLWREKVEFPALVAALVAARKKHPTVQKTYVEDKASGQQLLQVLGRSVTGLIAATPTQDKLARARLSILPRFEAGQLFLPEGAPWTDELVAECSRFPGGTHDDQVDMLSQVLGRLEAGNADLDFLMSMSNL